jgi:hypothetical protein
MKFYRTILRVCILAAIFAGGFFATAANAKTPPGASNVDAAKAQAGATVTLAGIKVSRVALDDDATLADVKETVAGIYDRQESATKDGVAKLKAAAGDSAKVAEAIAALQAANSESTAYFAAHADVKAKITKRATIINAEVKQISQTPDTYIAALGKAGVSGATLSQAKTLVKDASQKAAASTDSEAAGAPLAARVAVRKLLSGKQSQALDALMGGK